MISMAAQALNFPSFPKTKTFLLHSNTTKRFSCSTYKYPSSSSPSSSSLLVSHSTAAGFNEAMVVDEEMDKIRRLQNGSDVRGVAVDGEKGRSVDLTPAAMEAIGESFGEWVAAHESEKTDVGSSLVRVSVGRDPRISGARLSTGLFAGLGRAGCAVFDMGLATTPACFMSTVLPPFLYDASIMMTASHLPYTRNGLKFFTKKGGLTSPQVEEICYNAARKYANRLARVSTLLRILPTRVDFMSVYANHPLQQGWLKLLFLSL